MALPNVVPATFSKSRLNRQMTMPKPFAAILALAVCAFTAQAQTADRIPESFDPTPTVVLAGHHPQWASPANDVGALDANKTIDNLTMVLARSPQQEQAFEQFLEAQQTPGSPDYHHWLTPVEIGARFGVSDHDIASISGWLEGQGLHVNWVAPSRIFIAFGGTAANIGHAFGTELHAYKLNEEERYSVASDPRVPSALAPAILAVRGLYTVNERPQHFTRVAIKNSPDITLQAGSDYVVGPADFATIYDLPSSVTGSGMTIGIVGEAHVDPADVSNFQSFLGASFNTPTQVVPTAYGGVDPGAAYTTEPTCEAATPPTCSASETGYIDAQGEATLDVTRAGSVAPAANILLVTAGTTGLSDGIYTDAQYLTETTPLPAQVMSISFGGCESESGSADVNAWGSIYETAAGEGISIFVSSGDSGAAGCDTHGSTPPTTATAASPNALCSPIYETCVGGTEFNDAGDYSAYWSATNSEGYLSARSYIPEGAWNEPGSAGQFQVAATGGGVSQFIATPSWQTGTGVPAARAGRYTPDVAFTAAGHDGYFGCLAAVGGNCVNTAQGVPFVIFSGTSASAPDMAGVAALLDQSAGGAQGNITPEIYSLAASSPSAFHDVTVATSGVTSCSVGTPSMCNNSIASSTALTGGTAGYLVQTGYDEATGWGSLDVSTFLTAYAAAATPSFTLSASPTSVSVAPGGSGTSTITIAPTGGFSSAVAFTASGLPTGVTSSFAAGTVSDTEVLTLTASSSAAATSSPVTVTITGTSGSLTETTTVALTVTGPPSFTLSASSASVSVAQGSSTSSELITIVPAGGFTGTVTFAASGLPTGVAASFTAGVDTNTEALTLTASSSAPTTTSPISVTITGTSGSLTATTTVALTVTPPASYTLSASPASVSVADGGTATSTITIAPANGFAGSVTFTASGLPSGVTASFAIGTASDTEVLTLTASASAAVTSSPVTVTIKGTSGSLTATTTVAVSVTLAPSFTLSASPTTLSIAQGESGTSTVTITPANGFTGTVAFTASGLPSGVTSSFAAGTAADTEVLTLTASSSAAVDSTPATITITGTSGSLIENTTVALTITAAPSFTLSASPTAVSVAAGGTGTSTITVTPAAGLTGNVTLTASVTSSPSGAVDLPTLSFGTTSPVDITGTSAGTGTLTINTTGTGSAALARPQGLGRWYSAGGATLACLFLFAIPSRRRRAWRNMMGLVILGLVASAIVACGGGGGGGGNTGTTTGSYTITVTGTATGATTQSTTVTLTVN